MEAVIVFRKATHARAQRMETARHERQAQAWVVARQAAALLKTHYHAARVVAFGSFWHQALLRLAATDIPQLRPALISDATRNALDRYRGFRHVVRSIYSFELDKEQIAPLLNHLRPVFENAKVELIHFAEALRQSGNVL